MEIDYNERTCNKCGWVHFGVTREHAEAEVKRFNDYFNTLSEDKQQKYYGGNCSGIELYDRCSFCGNSYKDFRDSKEDDCPTGVTLGPIIKED